MDLLLIFPCKPCSEEDKNPPRFYTSLYVTLFLAWVGELVVSPMILQHLHIEVRSLHPLSLYNSSYFQSCLWRHRLMQMHKLWKAWPVSRAPSATGEGLLPLVCYKMPSCSIQQPWKGFYRPPWLLERKEHVKWVLPKEFFPTRLKPIPQGTSWVSPANGPWRIAAVSKTVAFWLQGFSCVVAFPPLSLHCALLVVRDLSLASVFRTCAYL